VRLASVRASVPVGAETASAVCSTKETRPSPRWTTAVAPQAVQAKRTGVGLYEVKFVNSPVTVMVGTVNGGSAPQGFIDSHNVAAGDFVIGTRDASGTLSDGHGFGIITP
jgi:hypothetical protein